MSAPAVSAPVVPEEATRRALPSFASLKQALLALALPVAMGIGLAPSHGRQALQPHPAAL